MDFVVPKEGDEQFDAAVHAKGLDSRYAHEKDPMVWPGLLVWSIAHGVVLVRDIFLREAGPKKRIPDIVGRTNTARSFGALAFQHDGRYFVSVNFGSLVLIQDLRPSHALDARSFPLGRGRIERGSESALSSGDDGCVRVHAGHASRSATCEAEG
ncbi:MAG TPA: hypothetical protein VGL61_21430 [Kofleriaceae bacterium]|jgi:hypothetical protein